MGRPEDILAIQTARCSFDRPPLHGPIMRRDRYYSWVYCSPNFGYVKCDNLTQSADNVTRRPWDVGARRRLAPTNCTSSVQPNKVQARMAMRAYTFACRYRRIGVARLFPVPRGGAPP